MRRNPTFFILSLCVLALLALFLPGCRGQEAAGEEALPPVEVSEPEPAPEIEPEPERRPESPQPEPELESEPQPEPEVEPAGEPDTLPALLVEAGYSAADIPGTQMVIVQASGNEASVWAYGVEGEVWVPLFEEVGGHVGKNGVTSEKTEGDRCTPKGLFGLSMAFGVEEDPGSLLPYRQVTEESYWVDDPDSRFYNQWVEGVGERDWSSAEHLADYPEQYAYAALINYNTGPIAAGAGSAIFLHCGSSATAGCVSIPREKMVDLLQWLDPFRDPVIFIF